MLWTEKYRPKNIHELIGQEIFKLDAENWIEIKDMPNLLLYGQAGVGKTAVVEGLAQRIVDANVPDSILTIKILQLDLALLVAGTRYRGDLEERLKLLLEEVQEQKLKQKSLNKTNKAAVAAVKVVVIMDLHRGHLLVDKQDQLLVLQILQLLVAAKEIIIEDPVRQEDLEEEILWHNLFMLIQLVVFLSLVLIYIFLLNQVHYQLRLN